MTLFDLTDIKPSYTLKELKVLLLDLQTCSDYYHKRSLLRGGKPNISEAVICSKFLVEQLDQCVRSHPLEAHPCPVSFLQTSHLQSP